MTIYQKATGKVEILNARERAPLAATEDMFLGDPELSLYGKKKIETQCSKIVIHRHVGFGVGVGRL